MEIIDSTLIKPSSPHPLSNTLVPLTVFDRAAFDDHVPTIIAFHAPTPTNNALKHGLSEALSYFPHAAGRMATDSNNRRCISLNNAGVHLVEARVFTRLSDKLPLCEKNRVVEFFPITEGKEELVAVQFTRFACGGLVIGFAVYHHCMDGHSDDMLLNAWAKAVRGSQIPIPFLDRSAVAKPRDPPMPVFNHGEIEFKPRTKISPSKFIPPSMLKNLAVHFSTEFVADLRALVPNRCSTFQLLLAHVWKKITVARGLKPDEFSEVRIAINVRGKTQPPTPSEFFGNMVLWAFPRLRVSALLAESHASVVKTIRQAVNRVDDEYIKSFIDFGKVAEAEIGDKLIQTATPNYILNPNLEVDSMLSFHFHDLDFGFGPPCDFAMPDLPTEGLMLFAPSFKEKGGVLLFIALLEDHANVFERICHTLPEENLQPRL